MPETPSRAWIWNQASALGRGGVWFVAGYAVGQAWVDGATAITIAGGVLTAVAAFLSGKANTDSSIVQAASQVPAVKEMAIADPQLAEAAKKADPETVVKFDPPPKSE